MGSRVPSGHFVNNDYAEQLGISHEIIYNTIRSTYDLLDRIDNTLLDAGASQLSQTVELANLSSMLGNIVGASIANHSNGTFVRNGPHKYPDLLSNSDAYSDIEIKVALENNKPKGHLAKAGHYLTCRYVLCDENGIYTHGKDYRGVTPYIWEVRGGHLDDEHFNLSNTAGDSGKTAVVNAAGMDALKVLYIDLDRAAVSRKGAVFKSYQYLAQMD